MSLLSKKERFSTLFDQYYGKLYRFALKSTRETDLSEELVQETFIKLWEHFENIDNVDRSIESYLIMTLKNKVIDLYRKTQSREKHINHFSLLQNKQIEIDDQWELNEQIDAVYASLDHKTREIFLLSRDQGLSYKAISEVKNISVKTVEAHISKGLAAFREGLKLYL